MCKHFHTLTHTLVTNKWQHVRHIQNVTIKKQKIQRTQINKTRLEWYD